MKTTKPKRFNYMPRYHDPRQEALDDLVERARAEREGKLPTAHQLRFERKYGVSQANRKSNVRILILVILLTAIAAIVFL